MTLVNSLICYNCLPNLFGYKWSSVKSKANANDHNRNVHTMKRSYCEKNVHDIKRKCKTKNKTGIITFEINYEQNSRVQNAEMFERNQGIYNTKKSINKVVIIRGLK